MKISVNCPSYNRPKVKTLAYLPFCNVWVAAEQLEDYKKHNKGFEDNFRVLNNHGNVSIARNEIIDREFEAGADVVCMIDDDMSGIYHFERVKGSNFGYDKNLVKAEDFEEFIISIR